MIWYLKRSYLFVYLDFMFYGWVPKYVYNNSFCSFASVHQHSELHTMKMWLKCRVSALNQKQT